MVIADINREQLMTAEYFPTDLQKFQYLDKYARFNYMTGRRETWIETVTRATNYLNELSGDFLRQYSRNGYQTLYEEIWRYIAELKAMPSMRLIAMAGEAARRDNTTIYNCSYIPVDSLESFVEALLISMSGCGVGFSVEAKYVEQLPEIQSPKFMIPETYVVEDTAEGWGNALRHGLEKWFSGEDVQFDLSKLRPAGAVLKTKGGRSSGPAPLAEMLSFVRDRVYCSGKPKLTTLDAHDIMCMVGNAAVSGGMRRTAMISLFDFDDQLMRHAKDAGFEEKNPQRWNANNSVVWTRHLTQREILEQFCSMISSENGEPGFFSRLSAQELKPERRDMADFGTNPCGEIILRPRQFCNLSIAVARADDTEETLRDKVEIATIIGTVQSMADYFPNLGPEWKKNAQEERLLGVDITGQQDSPITHVPEVMQRLRDHVVATNKKFAERLGIKQSASVTCVKPSGNSSQLLDCSSGLHSRWAEFYERNVRVSATSPVFKVLAASGVPMDPENGQTVDNATTYVAHFVVKSPEGARTRKDRGAIEQCEYWLHNKLNWTEHNPSVTITYKPEEVIDLIKWVYEHQEVLGGMAFLPAFDANYAQLPYVELSASEYYERASKWPSIDWSLIGEFEKEDMTTASQELACMSGVCSLDELPGT